ncbi:MAG: hypothetical protein AABZ45_09915 [Pseudomonadota bacterium]
MKFLKKAVVAAAAMSMVTAPVVASAAPAQFDGVRADTQVQNGMAFGEEGGSWILLLLAGLAIVAGIVIAAGGSSNAPTSP